MEERTSCRGAMSKNLRYRLCGWTALLLVTLVVGELYLHRSAPYRVARQFIEHSATVRQEVGSVRSASGWEGTVHYSGANGWASFRMNVRGSHGDGVVDITLRCQGGAWSVSSAELYTDTGEAVSITQKSASSTPRG